MLIRTQSISRYSKKLNVQQNLKSLFNEKYSGISALIDIWSYLPATQTVVGLGVGASIDFLLGLQKRDPIIFQKLGLEGLYRLILEPRKRWRRIYTALVEFLRMIGKKG